MRNVLVTLALMLVLAGLARLLRRRRVALLTAARAQPLQGPTLGDLTITPAQGGRRTLHARLRSNGAYRVTALEQEKLMPQWLALLLIVGMLLIAWRLEGR